jgi:Ca2+-binding RTX toxin-like protein
LITFIQAGTGDVVTVGSLAPRLGGSLSTIQGDVRIQAVTGQTPHVILDDSGDAAPRTVTLGGDPSFSYLISGFFNSTVGRGRIGLLLGPAVPVSILGGTGDDVYRIHDFTGAPAISLDAEPATSKRSNMHNKLDYSAYTGTVKVVLPLGRATGFASVAHIQDVAGGIGNSLLVGDANANILTGGTGRNILIGRAGADTLDTSLATTDNILIGGTTDYDTSTDALEAIFSEWTRTDLTFRERFSALSDGIGNPKGKPISLTKQTVHGDAAADKMTGTNLVDPVTNTRAHNWFFVDDADPPPVNDDKRGDHDTKVK